MQRKKITLAVSMALCLSQISGANAQFDPTIELSDLDGLNGIRFNGVAEFDNTGVSVSSAGDINGDGIDDVIIGANDADPNGTDRAGSSYVVFGTTAGLANPFDLSTLNGSNGFTINGVNDVDLSGFSVDSAGDINGDGFDDLIIGALYADPNAVTDAGSAYVVFGSNTSLPNPLNLSTLNGNNGFALHGIGMNDRTGRAVSSAGDINDDGIDDLIISADGASTIGDTNAGSSYVVFGSDAVISHPLDLSTLDGSNGFTIKGISAFDRSGTSVSAAGDINADGIDDLIIGADRAGTAGASYVVFGSDSGFSNTLNLSTLNGSNGFAINGLASGDLLGFSVNGAGDFNNDGIDDIVVGARGADPGGNSFAGSSYVIFGADSGIPHPFDLASLDGTNGLTLNGVAVDDYSGISVSSAGDVNGDGIGDLIIGANGADPNGENGAGSAYVVFGHGNLPHPFDLSTLDGNNGLTLNGIERLDTTGYSVSEAGDVNGDGLDDLIVGARLADPDGNTNAGSSYVVFGNDVIFKDGFE